MVLLASCSGAPAASENPSTATTPASTEGATIAPATPAATPVADSFVSPFYHYSLLLPPEAKAFGWSPASAAWDGVARMDSESQDIDRVLTAGGILFAFGQRTNADLKAYRAEIIAALTKWHPCSGVTERATTIAGEPAQLIACTSDSYLVTRLVLVHHGFGLVFTLDSQASAPVEQQMALLETYVAPIEFLP